MTVSEINKSIDSLYTGWLDSFTPMYANVTWIKGVMGKRIFGVGKSGGANTAGSKLPTVAYSKEPMYISAKSLSSAPSKFKVGKNGDPIKSLYFPLGYAQLKKETSAVLPLELTGFLKTGYRKYPNVNDGLDSAIVIESTELGKIKGLEQSYGQIFYPSKSELEAFTERLGQDMAKEIEKAYGK